VYSDKIMTVADAAREQGLTVAQLLGIEDVPNREEAWKYVYGQPLV
jgi:hypothetical protein